ncbi:MAG: hypothetical protein JXA99_10715 [Candidatus Lokiarchaeota archaeon]|nr:hypothetical protein [Candidatus Lokiarchaeota archaeon]
MAIRNKYAYCKQCGKPVKKAKKTKLESFHYQIIVIASIASLGIGLLVFIIYRLFIQKRKYCPICNNIVQFYKKPEDVPGPKVPVIHLLEKLDAKKEIKETKLEESRKFISCDNCKKDIDYDAKICPYCGWHHESTK